MNTAINMIPSFGVILESVLANTQKSPVTAIIKGISRLTISFVLFTGRMIAEIPRINAMFIMLEPIILPSERAGSPLREALRLTNNSGNEVPMAVIVNPIAILLNLRFNANFEADSISLSEE